MQKVKLLIVDDHTIIREGIRVLLGAREDIEVVGEACDGQEAVEKAKELSPDIIIMDITMPGIDGLEATRRIIKNNTHSKILILTQHDNREYLISAVRAGVVGYMPKRALSSELVSAIRTIHAGGSFLYPSATAALIEDYLHQAKEDPYEQLTRREREVLKLVAEGHTTREIAARLFIASKTVNGHRTKIMSKLNIHNRTQLIKFAIHKGLISSV